MRRVDKKLEDEDTENRRSEGGAPSTGDEGPHQQTRASVNKRGSSGRRARTPRRGQRAERAVEA